VIRVQFNEKLDFLMNITKTSNIALGQKVKLDASYISRLRRGRRSALKDISCIDSMAAYFARNCNEDYQRKAIADKLRFSTALADGDSLSKHIAKWLTDEKKDEATVIGSFLSGFTNIKSRPAPLTRISRKTPQPSIPRPIFPFTTASKGSGRRPYIFSLK
jgi:hypothetical protein